MTGRMQGAARGGLALLLGGLAWGVSHSYALLTGGQALLVAVLTGSAVLCPFRSRPGRILAAPLLALTLLAFWYILHDRLADRNLVLVGLLVALTGLFATGVKA